MAHAVLERAPGAPPVVVDEAAPRAPSVEVAVVALVAFAAYLTIGWWLRVHLHYFVGDALARTANAAYVAVSRDPHLGAIGFYWPPLPSFLQIPLVYVLAPFHHVDLAGPWLSAATMAATIPVVARICDAFGTTRSFRIAVVLAFALNPMIVFFGANGMGEGCFFLASALALLGFVRWVRDGTPSDLALLALGLTAGVLVRYEALGFVAVLAVLAALRSRRPWLDARVLTAVALPPVFAFVVWMLVQQLLLRDALFFLHVYVGTSDTNLFWLPDPKGNPMVAVVWALSWVVIMSPVLLLVPAIYWLRTRERDLATVLPEVKYGMGIAGCALVFPALEAFLLLRHRTGGNPRYFMLLILFGAVAAAWMVGRGWRHAAWPAALVLLLTVGAGAVTVKLTDGRATHLEGESAVFRRLLREPAPGIDPEWQTWRAVTLKLDSLLTGKRRVLADTSYSFPAVLYTHKRSHFVIPSDRDWEKTVADPGGKVDVVILPNAAYLKRKSTAYGSAPKDVLEAEPGSFELAGDFGIVSLWVRK
jgi:hypothetical protein